MDITCATVDSRAGQSASSGLRIAFTDRAVPDEDGERDKESGGGGVHYDDNVSFDGGATATMKFRQGPRIEGQWIRIRNPDQDPSPRGKNDPPRGGGK
jgi:hypothetical protein